MDFLATPNRRKILFASLYLSEGAPIGFLWLALPTQLRVAGVPLEQITTLTALLVIPWTFKFVWAPLVDLLQFRWWSLRQWIISAQTIMALTLLPLLWFDLAADFAILFPLLLLHALAAATQDVGIDALCIASTDPGERTQLNGWMQAGMLTGRAMMGGGALMLDVWLGSAAVVGLLIAITFFSAVLVAFSRTPVLHPATTEEAQHAQANWLDRVRHVFGNLRSALKSPTTWRCILFALTAPAVFKALEVVIGPFLIDRGFTKFEVGRFTATVMIGAMIVGSLVSGVLAKRFRHHAFVSFTLVSLCIAVSALAIFDTITFAGAAPGSAPADNESARLLLLVCLGVIALLIGMFTVAFYAWLMDNTRPAIAATQFSAYMGMTNGCEAWSVSLMGWVGGAFGYPIGLGVLTCCSLAALLLIRRMPTEDSVT